MIGFGTKPDRIPQRATPAPDPRTASLYAFDS